LGILTPFVVTFGASILGLSMGYFAIKRKRDEPSNIKD
jgi:hypothetical protein